MRGIGGLPGIGVIADDLTGALASAARLNARGLRTVVEWQPRPVQSAEALVINIATRERNALGATGQSPKQRARQAAERLRELGCERFELRIDSTLLRGRPAEELEGLLEGIHSPDACVLAVPAYPLAGRVTRDGSQLCLLQGLAEDIDRAVAPRLFPEDRVKHFSVDEVRAGAEPLAEAALAACEAGARRFVADATRESDLLVLARAAAEIERSVELVTVSSGAWLHFHPYAMARARKFVLVALGSSTEVNSLQFDRLREADDVVVLTPREAYDLVISRDRLLAVLSDTPCLVIATAEPADTDERRMTISREIADAAEALLTAARGQRYSCRGIIATGGFTAQQVARKLDAELIDPQVELRPLCPMGRLTGGQWSGLPVVLKGGLVGRPTTMVELVEALVQATEDATPPPVDDTDDDLAVDPA
jgi:uncharacterized protein YgbK (DUF1537 family)